MFPAEISKALHIFKANQGKKVKLLEGAKIFHKGLIGMKDVVERFMVISSLRLSSLDDPFSFIS